MNTFVLKNLHWKNCNWVFYFRQLISGTERLATLIHFDRWTNPQDIKQQKTFGSDISVNPYNCFIAVIFIFPSNSGSLSLIKRSMIISNRQPSTFQISLYSFHQFLNRTTDTTAVYLYASMLNVWHETRQFFSHKMTWNNSGVFQFTKLQPNKFYQDINRSLSSFISVMLCALDVCFSGIMLIY